MIKSEKLRGNLGLVLTYVFLMAMMVAAVFPALWIFGSSLNPGDSLFSTSIIPERATWAHYKELFTEMDFPIWFWNSIKVGLSTSALVLLLCMFTAYAFSRHDFYGRKSGLMTILVLQMFPGMMSMVAIYVVLNMIGLLDTHLGLILIYAGGAVPYQSWLMKGYFDTLPRSLEEAAIIDGASRWTVLWRILVPLSLPIISVVAIFNFVAPFGDYLLARLILTSPEKWTLAVGLYDFISGQFGKHFTQFAAGAVLAALPITILYLLLQNLLISGLTQGSTKG